MTIPLTTGGLKLQSSSYIQCVQWDIVTAWRIGGLHLKLVYVQCDPQHIHPLPESQKNIICQKYKKPTSAFSESTTSWHIKIEKNKRKSLGSCGHVFKRDFKVWKVFNNFADFRSFSEKMKYKKTNDISKIVQVLRYLRVFYATPNLQKNFSQKYLKLNKKPPKSG